MLFRDQRKPELIVRESSSGEPTAVVVLLGWFGSKLRHVSKYEELYENCVTITTTLDTRTLMVLDEVKIDEMANLLTTESAKLLRKYPNASLICHAFSNGGGIPLMRFEEGMLKSESEDQKLLRSRYTTSIFDSAPAFPDMETFERSITEALPNPMVRTVLFWVVFLYYQWNNFIQTYMYQQQAWGELYWKHWETCPLPSGQQVYVYSAADKITKPEKLDQLVDTRRQFRSSPDSVTVLKFSDTAHVQHLRSRKAEYKALLKGVLKNLAVGVPST